MMAELCTKELMIKQVTIERKLDRFQQHLFLASLYLVRRRQGSSVWQLLGCQ